MRKRVLGNTGIQVSEIGFGGWAIGGNAHGESYGYTDDQQSLAAITSALDLGCTLFDTADAYGYGHSELLLGQALATHPDTMIATKVGNNFYGDRFIPDYSPSHIRFALDESRRRLQRDVIDVYLLHNPPIEIISDQSTYDVLEELKALGKISAYGVSVLRVQDAFAALQVGRPAVIQVAYSLLNTEAEALFAEARRDGVGVIAREPLSNGFLTGKYSADVKFEKGDFRADLPRQYVQAMVSSAQAFRFLEIGELRTLAQAAIRFALDQEGVASVIVGAKSPAQVREDFGASDVPGFTPDEVRRIRMLMGDH